MDSPVLLLWRRSAAIALIGPLAWEPYAAGVALKKTKKKSLQIINAGEGVGKRELSCGRGPPRTKGRQCAQSVSVHA